MTIINIYEDPDYGWTVMDHSGLITPCEDFDGVIKKLKEIGRRFGIEDHVCKDVSVASHSWVCKKCGKFIQ